MPQKFLTMTGIKGQLKVIGIFPSHLKEVCLQRTLVARQRLPSLSGNVNEARILFNIFENYSEPFSLMPPPIKRHFFGDLLLCNAIGFDAIRVFLIFESCEESHAASRSRPAYLPCLVIVRICNFSHVFSCFFIFLFCPPRIYEVHIILT